MLLGPRGILLFFVPGVVFVFCLLLTIEKDWTNISFAHFLLAISAWAMVWFRISEVLAMSRDMLFLELKNRVRDIDKESKS